MSSVLNDLSVTGVKAGEAKAVGPLTADELRKLNAYWRACNYLAAGMIYLRDNPLLREPLKPRHIKLRLLGHWGASPGLSFAYIHMNRLIKKYDLDAIFIAGPGHGAQACLAPVYLEGAYSEVYPNKAEDEAGMRAFFKEFSFPGGIGSHCTPGDARLDPRRRRAGIQRFARVWRGVRQSGPDRHRGRGRWRIRNRPAGDILALNKFLNPIRDGAVLPILHLNGYKINNPTLLARISHEELEDLFKGYGWTPYFVEGNDPEMHAPEDGRHDGALRAARSGDIQQEARAAARPRGRAGP